MASRLSHELRTPIAVVRSSLDNLKASPLPATRASTWRAPRRGWRGSRSILTRMTEAARLEQSLSDVERVRFDLVPVVSGLRRRLPPRLSGRAHRVRRARDGAARSTARPTSSRRCSTSSSPTPSSSRRGGAIEVRLEQRRRATCTLTRGQRRAAAAAGHGRAPVRIDGLGARRPATPREPHLGLGLYIVRVIAQFHGGEAIARRTSPTGRAWW